MTQTNWKNATIKKYLIVQTEGNRNMNVGEIKDKMDKKMKFLIIDKLLLERYSKMSYFCKGFKMRKNTLEYKIKTRIKRSKTSVFVRKGFFDLNSDMDQVGWVLKKLTIQNILIKIGFGLYAKSRKSLVSDNIIIDKPLQELAKQSAQKLGYKIIPTPEQQAYNADKTTQVPTGNKIVVQGRYSRTLSYNGASVYIVSK